MNAAGSLGVVPASDEEKPDGADHASPSPSSQSRFSDDRADDVEIVALTRGDSAPPLSGSDGSPVCFSDVGFRHPAAHHLGVDPDGCLVECDEEGHLIECCTVEGPVARTNSGRFVVCDENGHVSRCHPPRPEDHAQSPEEAAETPEDDKESPEEDEVHEDAAEAPADDVSSVDHELSPDDDDEEPSPPSGDADDDAPNPPPEEDMDVPGNKMANDEEEEEDEVPLPESPPRAPTRFDKKLGDFLKAGGKERSHQKVRDEPLRRRVKSCKKLDKTGKVINFHCKLDDFLADKSPQKKKKAKPIEIGKKTILSVTSAFNEMNKSPKQAGAVLNRINNIDFDRAPSHAIDDWVCVQMSNGHCRLGWVMSSRRDDTSPPGNIVRRHKGALN